MWTSENAVFGRGDHGLSRGGPEQGSRGGGRLRECGSMGSVAKELGLSSERGCRGGERGAEQVPERAAAPLAEKELKGLVAPSSGCTEQPSEELASSQCPGSTPVQLTRSLQGGTQVSVLVRTPGDSTGPARGLGARARMPPCCHLDSNLANYLQPFPVLFKSFPCPSLCPPALQFCLNVILHFLSLA